MINIDYKIIRNESDEQREYVPAEEIKEIPDLTIVSGPNSSGKSSLLNFIAMAFCGKDSKMISESLKKKIETVETNERQRTQLSLKIESGGKSLSFEKPFDNNQIRIRENGKALSLDNFKRKYEILYDIPEDPIGRLAGLTSTIEKNQNRYKKRVERLKDAIIAIQEAVAESRNDEAIEELRREISADEAQFIEKEKQFDEAERELEILTKYVYQKVLSKKIVNVRSKREELEELRKRKRKTGKGRSTARIKASKDTVCRFVYSIDNDVEIVCDALYGLGLGTGSNFGFFSQCDLMKSLQTYRVENKFEKMVDYYTEIFQKEQQQIHERKGQIETENLVNAIIELLKRENSDISIPGINKTVGEMLETLSDAKKGFNNFSKKERFIEDGCEALDRIKVDIEQLNEKLEEYQRVMNESNEDGENIVFEEDIKRAEKEIEDLEKDLTEFRRKCLEHGVAEEMPEEDRQVIFQSINERKDAKELRVAQDSKLMALIDDEGKSIEGKKTELDRISRRKESKKDELRELEKREPHKYSGMEIYIQRILDRCYGILRKMQKYERFIAKIDDKETLNEEGFEEYNECVSRYLGTLMSTIRHVDKEYDTDKIDLLKEEVLTTSGKTILFSEMGTGQGQRAYLLSQLENIEQGDKQAVVLFDEIETMDNKSLNPIKKKMSEMYKKGKLIAGVMVEKGNDEINVVKMTEA